MKKNILLQFLLLLLIAIMAQPSSALMLKAGLEDLTLGSDIIVIGKVKGLRCEWNRGKKLIYTCVKIETSDVIKGKITQNEITVKHLGGVVGEIGMMVSHAPVFNKEEEVLLFLRRQGKIYRVWRMEQGKYTVIRDKEKEQVLALSNDKREEKSIKEIPEEIGEAVKLDSLVKKIKIILKKEGKK